jgi:glycosyltransferase involved in cell wall biosynthesis
MKILVVTPRPYGPRVGSGGGLLCFQQLRHLAMAHEIVFVCFMESDASAEQARLVDALKGMCRSVHTVPAPNGFMQALYCKLNLYLRGVPPRVTLHTCRAMRRMLREVVARERPDVALVQFPWMAQHVDLLGGVPAVMDVQDSFSVSAYRAALVEPSRIRKLHALATWLAWVRHERTYYPRFSDVVVLTDQDRMGLALYSPALRAQVNPPAIDVPAFIPRHPRKPYRLAFVGALSHPPNVVGLEHFIQHIFPLVLQRQPNAELHVAGRSPPKRLSRYAGSNVRFVGYVDDLGAFLGEASAVVVPLVSGGGIKVKTLEALGLRAPVVSTSIGAEESGAIDGQHLLIRDGAREFADAVVELLRSPALAERLAAAGQNLVRTRFAPEQRLGEFEKIVHDAARRGRKCGSGENDITGAATAAPAVGHARRASR